MITLMDNRKAPDEARVQKIEFRAMGSHMLAAVESDDPDVSALLAEVPGWFAGWEQALSRFKDDSELSELNRASSASSALGVSETLWTVLQLALKAAHDSGGLVTPTVLNALERAGYNASFDDVKGRIETSTNAPGAGAENAGTGLNPRASVTWRDIKTSPGTRSVTLPSGLRLDFGGIAKGWAADEAAKMLAKYGPALVDAGGDIAVRGTQDRQVDWPVGVDAPAIPNFPGPTSPDGLLDLLAIRSGGVATSGRDYRRWQQDGAWRHHIIDPRTEQPAETDVMTATVIAPTACEAEIAAKVVLLLGSNDGLAWLDARPSMAGLLVLDSGKVLRSRRFDNYVWSNENGN
jgi:thiamine biosynthesis lipoprotein